VIKILRYLLYINIFMNIKKLIYVVATNPNIFYER